MYLKLSLWQLNDLRLEMPKAVLQILHTIAMNTDVTILTTCLRFLALIFELHSLLFSSCVDIILEKISVSKAKLHVGCVEAVCNINLLSATLILSDNFFLKNSATEIY